MGQKVSAINGVKSEDYVKPDNAINEIWVGNTEIISRLPFGGSDMAQAAWPKGGMPNIPWHNFIIPMKRDVDASSVNTSVAYPDESVCFNRQQCIASRLTEQDALRFVDVFLTWYAALEFLKSSIHVRRDSARFYHLNVYSKRDAGIYTIDTVFAATTLFLGCISIMMHFIAVREAHILSWSPVVEGMAFCVLLSHLLVALWAVYTLFKDTMSIRRNVRTDKISVKYRPGTLPSETITVELLAPLEIFDKTEDA